MLLKKDHLATVTGDDQGVLNVLNGDADAAFVFEDARNTVIKDNPKIMSQVVPIYFTKPIPNDTISVVPNMSKPFRKKLAKHLLLLVNLRRVEKLLKAFIAMKVILMPKIATSILFVSTTRLLDQIKK